MSSRYFPWVFPPLQSYAFSSLVFPSDRQLTFSATINGLPNGTFWVFSASAGGANCEEVAIESAKPAVATCFAMFLSCSEVFGRINPVGGVNAVERGMTVRNVDSFMGRIVESVEIVPQPRPKSPPKSISIMSPFSRPHQGDRVHIPTTDPIHLNVIP